MVEVEIEVEVEVEDRASTSKEEVEITSVEWKDERCNLWLLMMIWFPVDKCVDLSPCSFWLQATG
jgi:hypothetical protein